MPFFITLLTCLLYLCVASHPFNVDSDAQRPLPRRQTSRFLNEKSARFSINGTEFPHVPLDIGESYGGLLPVSANQNDTQQQQQLYFWFFPSDNPDAHDEITVWLNGGPGCSSLIGLLQENGKFLWQPGQAGPVLNDWSWTKLTNVVWIDQPVGAGFAQGTPSATSTEELAPQFMGFWKNFMDTFNMTGSKVYLAGESYAGVSSALKIFLQAIPWLAAGNPSRLMSHFPKQYIPYFASAMLNANETDPGYFDVRGTLLIDPAISSDVALVELPMLRFAEANQHILRFNESFRAYMSNLHANEFNYTAFFDEYFTFPATGPMPTPPNADEGDSPFRTILGQAASLINPCFNVYNILDHCPTPYDPLGLVGPQDPTSGLGQVFFNLTEVKAAMHAPDIPWAVCAAAPVFTGFGGVDLSPRPSFSVLPGVFERVPLNIVGNGALDFLIPSNGTLFALQNTTWAGATGFEERPSRRFIVPGRALVDESGAQKTLGAVGEMGTWVYERGVLFVDVEGAGHELPQHNPSAAFRLLEVLLGRVGVEQGMGGGAAWTV